MTTKCAEFAVQYQHDQHYPNGKGKSGDHPTRTSVPRPGRSISVSANSTDNTPLDASHISPEFCFRKWMAATIHKKPIAIAQMEMKAGSAALMAGARRVTDPAQMPTTPSSTSSQRSPGFQPPIQLPRKSRRS